MSGLARRVFVVDDETTIATTLALVLHRHGFDAVAFTDPMEALYAAEAHCPNLLLTEVIMPQLNGVDLGVQFKAMYPSCKVLLFSGNARTSDLLGPAKEQGHSFGVLAKPLHPKDLLATIESILT